MDDDVQMLVSGDPDRAVDALKSFLERHASSYTFPELNHNNYRRELWRALHNHIKNARHSHFHVHSLAAIRTLSRDKTDINEIVNDDLMDCIIEHAALKSDQDFEDQQVHSVALEALKCLCNLIFNSQIAAAVCCKNGTIEGVARRLRTFRDPKMPPDIKYFDIKILFLITALCPEVRNRLKEELHGLTYLIESLDLILKESTGGNHNADKLESPDAKALNDQQVDICCEILKALFNLTLREINAPVDEEEEAHYVRLVAILHDYLVIDVASPKKKTELTNHLINLLTNMPNSCYTSLIAPIQDGQAVSKELQYDEQDMSSVHEVLRFLKEKFAVDMTSAMQSDNLAPVLTTLLKAAVGVRLIRKYLRCQILPPLRDVHHRPEQGNTLRNYLCRLLTSPTNQVRDLSAEFLFVLCKESVNRMIKYTGYGNAAGVFASRGLLGGRNGDVSGYSSDSEDSDTEEYRQYKHGINPVVGCYEPPHPNPTAHMTEEQKEYEAMKLVELMDNLTRTGVVKPCKIGEDGRPEPVEHILQLQEGLRDQQVHMDDESD